MDKFNVNTIEKVFSDKIDSLIGTDESNIALAFSGGADSLALLALCAKKYPSKRLFPLYVNHKIRKPGELKEELKLNEENCKILGLKFNTVELDSEELQKLAKQYGTEAAARTLRYKKLEEFADANNCSYILTAHHKDDLLETIYMRVKGHSPVTSLRGISEVKGRVVRPLLEFHKSLLEEYLRLNNLTWSNDSTNFDNSFRRNMVRNVLLPEFLANNKDGERKLLGLRDTALKLCEDFEFNENSIDLDYFNSLNREKQYIVLYSMWDRTVKGLISMKMLDRVILAAKKRTSYEEIEMGAFCIANNRLFAISKQDDEKYSDFKEKLVSNMKIIDFECNIKPDSSNLKALHLDVSLFCGQPYVRFPQVGDRITLNGGTKTVLKVLQDMKVPRGLRFRTPVIADDNGIVAVFGSVWGCKDRLANRFRVSDYSNLACITFACLNK